MSALYLLLAEVDRTSSVVRSDGVSLSWRLGGRGTTEFSIKSLDGSFIPECGYDVGWYDSLGTKIWGGIVHTTTPRALYKSTASGVPVVTRCECASYELLMDRRIVAKAVYQNKTCKEILDDIFLYQLPENGHFDINHGISVIQDGVTLNYYVIDHMRASDILDDLAARSGYTWWVGPERDLYFVARATSPGVYFAPFSITDAAPNVRELSIKKSLDGYRNRQHIRVSFSAFSPSTQTIVGDGATSQWTLYGNDSPVVATEIKYIESITVTSGSPVTEEVKTFGILGVDTDKDFYYEPGGSVLYAGGSPVTLYTSDQSIAVVWRHLGGDVLTAENGAQVAVRSALESAVYVDSTGIYEHLIDESSDVDAVAHLAKAQAVLDAYDEIGTEVNGVTDERGLAPGQVLTINVSTPPFDGSVLIDELQAEYMNDSVLRFTFHASTSAYDDWVKQWDKVLAGSASGTTIVGNVGNAVSGSAVSDGGITFVIDGGGRTPGTGSKGYVRLPYNGTITACELYGDVSGSAQVTIKKATYPDFPTTTSIVAAAPPTLSSEQKSTVADLSTWTTSLAAGDILEFVLDSATSITRLSINLHIAKLS